MDIFFFFFPNDTDIPEKENTGFVFISYSSKDTASAEAFRSILHKNGIQTWMAPTNIPAGSDYATEINSAIKNCSCLLLLLTNSTQKSVWVPKEVERALNHRKAVIPVQLEDVNLNGAFEFFISTAQILPIREIDENTPQIQELIHILKKHTSHK